MKDKVRNWVHTFGIPRIIIIVFFILLCIIAAAQKLPVSMIFSDILIRFGMNGILVFAMVPGILSGIGLNFGLPIGILAGIVGGLLSIELNLTGWMAFAASIAFALPLAAIIGYLYGLLLNRVKGSEMMIGTYAGFSAVSLMSIGWLLLPFKSAEIRWPIGQGLRTTITLESRYDKILDSLWGFRIRGVYVPTGLILFFVFVCLLVWLFLRSKTGIMMAVAGDNERFAKASAIPRDKMRVIGTTLSTVLGAVGMIVYAQSYGFYQLYQAPMMMGFGAVAGILIGGASMYKAQIKHVVIGTFLFQGLLTIGLPVANAILPEGNLSKIVRIIVSNGIILYALTKAKGGDSND